MDTFRIFLARRRAEPLITRLRQNVSRAEQIKVLRASRSIYGQLGWTGGPFDLEILLDDPKFRIPWRTRRTTERMITQAKANVLAKYAEGR